LALPDLSTLTDEEVLSLDKKYNGGVLEQGDRVGFFGRLAMSFADSPKGRAEIAKNMGIKGLDMNPTGFDIGDIADMVGPSFPVIGGGIGGAIGSVVGSGVPGIGTVTTGAAGGTIGAAGFEGARQGIASLLGAQDTAGSQGIANEAGMGAAGELGGALAVKAGSKLLAPFKSQVTRRMGAAQDAGAQLDSRLGTELQRTSPVSSRTESQLLSNMEGRTAFRPSSGDKFRDQLREPLREQQNLALDQIQKQGNIPASSSKDELGQVVRGAAEETLAQREALVDDLYDQARAAIPDGLDLQASVTNVQSAIQRIAETRGAVDLQGFKITESLSSQLGGLSDDVSKIKTFDQLDAFRKRFGDILKSPGARQEFSNAGMDSQLRGIYSALKSDLDETMVAAFKARGKITGLPSSGSGIERGNLADATKAMDSMRRASATFKDILDLDASSAIRLLKDPDKVGNIARTLTGQTTTPAQILRFKQKIGAEGTELLPVTEAGEGAWRQFQANVLDILRSESVDESTDVIKEIPLDGERMLRSLKSLGGEPVLKAILPEQTVDDLFSLATFMRQTSRSKRAGVFRTPEELPLVNMNDIFSMGKRLVTRSFDSMLSPLLFSETGKRYLTTGLGQGPASQGFTSALGRAAAQLGIRQAPYLVGAQ